MIRGIISRLNAFRTRSIFRAQSLLDTGGDTRAGQFLLLETGDLLVLEADGRIVLE